MSQFQSQEVAKVAEVAPLREGIQSNGGSFVSLVSNTKTLKIVGMVVASPLYTFRGQGYLRYLRYRVGLR